MMQSCGLLSCGRSPSLAIGSPAIAGRRFRKDPSLLQHRYISRLRSSRGIIKAQASNVDIGAGSYDGAGQNDRDKSPVSNSNNEISSQSLNPKLRSQKRELGSVTT